MNGQDLPMVPFMGTDDDGDVEIPDTLVSCDWREDPREYDYAPPGCIGFNGHQVIFHCFTPGRPYRARTASTDPCLITLTTLNGGEQACTIIYEKPPPPPRIPPRIVCKTDRVIQCALGDLYLEKTIFEAETQTDTQKKKPAKGGDKKKKGKKGGKKK